MALCRIKNNKPEELRKEQSKNDSTTACACDFFDCFDFVGNGINGYISRQNALRFLATVGASELQDGVREDSPDQLFNPSCL